MAIVRLSDDVLQSILTEWLEPHGLDLVHARRCCHRWDVASHRHRTWWYIRSWRDFVASFTDDPHTRPVTARDVRIALDAVDDMPHIFEWWRSHDGERQQRPRWRLDPKRIEGLHIHLRFRTSPTAPTPPLSFHTGLWDMLTGTGARSASNLHRLHAFCTLTPDSAPTTHTTPTSNDFEDPPLIMVNRGSEQRHVSADQRALVSHWASDIVVPFLRDCKAAYLWDVRAVVSPLCVAPDDEWGRALTLSVVHALWDLRPRLHNLILALPLRTLWLPFGAAAATPLPGPGHSVDVGDFLEDLLMADNEVLYCDDTGTSVSVMQPRLLNLRLMVPWDVDIDESDSDSDNGTDSDDTSPKPKRQHRCCPADDDTPGGRQRRRRRTRHVYAMFMSDSGAGLLHVLPRLFRVLWDPVSGATGNRCCTRAAGRRRGDPPFCVTIDNVLRSLLVHSYHTQHPSHLRASCVRVLRCFARWPRQTAAIEHLELGWLTVTDLRDWCALRQLIAGRQTAATQCPGGTTTTLTVIMQFDTEANANGPSDDPLLFYLTRPHAPALFGPQARAISVSFLFTYRRGDAPLVADCKRWLLAQQNHQTALTVHFFN